MSDCIFCKIVSGVLPAEVVYEDDLCLAFKDIHPKAKVHVLLIPKVHIASLMESTDKDKDLLGHLFVVAPRIAKSLGLEKGFRTVVNTGQLGGQEVYHLHLHILGGPVVS